MKIIPIRNIRYSRIWLYLKGLFCNWKECVLGICHYLSLDLLTIKPKSILIVEFNPFHGETLPGYVYYFTELGYNVKVLSRYVTYVESPFVRMEKMPEHFCLTIWGMRHFVKSKKAKEFDFILYNSAHLYLSEYRFFDRLSAFLGGEILGGRRGFALIEHSLKPGSDLNYFLRLPMDAQEKQNLFHHSFALMEQEVDGWRIPMLNPCYFGKVRQKHSLNDKRILLTIGNVTSDSRNFNFLFDAIEVLDNMKHYEVWIIGKILDKEIIEKIPSCVKVLGRLTFAEMYDRLEQADFFLPLLDPQTQPLYLHGCTSGSRQLILGFCIPPIIHEAFAEHYGFMPGSCLMYNQKITFISAIRQALEMENGKYENMRLFIEGLQTEVRKTSIDNLRTRLFNNGLQ